MLIMNDKKSTFVFYYDIYSSIPNLTVSAFFILGSIGVGAIVGIIVW